MADELIRGAAAYAYDHPVFSGETNPISDATEECDREEISEDLNSQATESQTGEFIGSQNHPSTDVSGDVGVGLDVLGGGIKELVQAVHGLRNLGIESHDLPLPKIAVIGGQSAGKSSLIEGISEIKVPRQGGCCTRCPLEINLKESVKATDAWACQVLLYQKYTYDTSGMKAEAATRSRPLGPWVLKEPEMIPFATVSSKADVTNVLYCAQLATLNPSKTPDIYKPGAIKQADGSAQVQFSPNVVQINISGPALPNLHFYDLPGVISVSERSEEKYVPKLVENLVMEYIRAENCINLLAIPMTDDPANSRATALITQAKAENRTIGVLTKPDRMQKGESNEQWASRLSGAKAPLGFGYHIIKNNPDPLVDHTTARAEEAEFFSHKEPFATELAEYSEQFGTARLQSILSQKLTALIQTSLPLITERVMQKIAAIDIEIQSLPETPRGNLPMVILGLLRDFFLELQKYIDGGSEKHPFQKLWHSLAQNFRATLDKTHPTLLLSVPQLPTHQTSSQLVDPFTRDQSATPTSVRRTNVATISLDSDDETTVCDSKSISGSGKKRTMARPPPHKRTKLSDIPEYKGDKSLARKYTLNEIRSIIQDAYVGLPGQVDPKAIERMTRESAQHWKSPLADFMSNTEMMCQTLIHERLEKIFASLQSTQLYQKVINICAIFLKELFRQQREAAKRYLTIELKKPMTFNKEAMQQAQDKALAHLQKGRHLNLATIYLNKEETRINKTITSGPVRDEKIAKVTDAQLGPDEYTREISTMAVVRGYYECSFSRFVDVICQSINAELFADIRDKIFDTLVDQLGIMEPDASERCAQLLAVDPKIEGRRIQLKKEKTKLEEAQKWLEDLSNISPEHNDHRISMT